jgi:phosphoserine phosphatase
MRLTRRILLQIVFDMDGTLTESTIDFLDMRNRTGVPFNAVLCCAVLYRLRFAVCGVKPHFSPLAGPSVARHTSRISTTSHHHTRHAQEYQWATCSR